MACFRLECVFLAAAVTTAPSSQSPGQRARNTHSRFFICARQCHNRVQRRRIVLAPSFALLCIGLLPKAEITRDGQDLSAMVAWPSVYNLPTYSVLGNVSELPWYNSRLPFVISLLLEAFAASDITIALRSLQSMLRRVTERGTMAPTRIRVIVNSQNYRCLDNQSNACCIAGRSKKLEKSQGDLFDHVALNSDLECNSL